MKHRIRAVGILIQNDKVLLLRVNDSSGEYWIPPGGGLEDDDHHTKACLQREYLEEAGIQVDIGELICVREFLETTRNIYHSEFFYHIKHYQGEPHINNLTGLNDEAFIKGVEWVSLSELNNRRTFPTDLTALTKLAVNQRYSTHLGSYIQGDNEICNQMR